MLRPTPDAETLRRFDVVVKSPGISPYTRGAGRQAARHALHRRHRAVVRRESGCAHGLRHRHQGQEHDTALIAHLLRAAGQRTALAGNIGLPLLELLDVHRAGVLGDRAVELPDPRGRASPESRCMLNLFPEHLDWHGSEQRYFDDKLALLTRRSRGVAVLNAADRTWAWRCRNPAAGRWFSDASGWHVRDGVIQRGSQR